MDLDWMQQEEDIQHKEAYRDDGCLCYQELMRHRTQWERVNGQVAGGAHWRNGDLETNQSRSKGGYE
jgi:hypothetical protein